MAFWKPGAERPASSLDRTSMQEAAGALDPALASAGTFKVSGETVRLPVHAHRDAMLYLVERHGVVVIVGHTGCGKTTQIPQFLVDAGWAADAQRVVCTQPRRVAATSVAARVAEERGCMLGGEVGYTIRFEDCTHPAATRLSYVTPGLLFRECMRDPLLSRYSVVMVDEAHERGAYTDLLMAVLKKIRRKRPSLRVILSSATVDADALARYYTDAGGGDEGEPHALGPAILSIEGRTFPVEIAYTREPVRDYVAAAIDAVWALHGQVRVLRVSLPRFSRMLQEPRGDILVFLTGQEEIDYVLQALADRQGSLRAGQPALHLLPLYAGLGTHEQMAVFQPAPRGARKVVVATNVAEASVTVDGIRYVVDCGYTKARQMDTETGLDMLAVVPTSRASATQRAGRAGRTAPGKCLRLYPEAQLATLASANTPELVRSDVAPYLLQLKALGIDNLARFDFVPPAPSAGAMARALTYLGSLHALDEWGRLQPRGERLAEAPLDPMMATALLYAAEAQCAEEVLTIAAMASVASPFPAFEYGPTMDVAAEVARRKFVAEEGDHLTLLNVYNAFVSPRIGRQSARWAAKHALHYAVLKRAVAVRAQLARYYTLHWRLPLHSAGSDHVCIRKCLAAGFFKHAAQRRDDGTYRAATHDTVLHVHPSSVLFSRTPPTRWVVFQEVTHTTKPMMRDLTVIERDWLVEVAPHYYETKQG
ncbi:RNA helicase [Malassezia sp. CBS 17886]|nr:RNA helicase [Malassezia sp. CBS 17886]